MTTKDPIAPSHATELQRALDLAAAGIPVFFVKKKVPVNSGGFKSATTDPGQIRQWCTMYPTARVAVPMGAASGIMCADHDIYKDDYDASSCPDMGDTLCLKTPSGGLHYIFKHVPGVKSGNNKLGTGIDVKAEGGYIVLYGDLDASRIADASSELVARLLASSSPDHVFSPVEPTSDDDKLFNSVKAAVSMLDPDMGRDDWIKVLAAIHSTQHPDALLLAQEWSRGSFWFGDGPGSYKGPDDVEYQFKSVPPKFDGITYATIFKMATPLGFNPGGNGAAPLQAAPVADDFWTPASELTRDRTPTPRLIKGLLTCGSVSLWYGDSEAGKSLVLQLAGYQIATGAKKFHSFDIKRHGAVFYLAGEGHWGVRLRMALLEQHSEQSADWFFVSKQGANLTDPSRAADLVDSIRQASEVLGVEVQLVIIDTLHRNSAGDENSSHDMGLFVASVDKLKDGLGCAVAIVHHTGHTNKGRARGSYSLPAAVDFAYRVQKSAHGYVNIECTKAKDMAKPDPFSFKIVVEEIDGWLDEDGDPEKSARLVSADYPKSIQVKLTPRQIQFLNALGNMIDREAATEGSGDLDVELATTIDVNEWRSVCNRLPDDGGRPPSVNTFKSVQEALQKAGVISVIDGKVSMQ